MVMPTFHPNFHLSNGASLPNLTLPLEETNLSHVCPQFYNHDIYFAIYAVSRTILLISPRSRSQLSAFILMAGQPVPRCLLLLLLFFSASEVHGINYVKYLPGFDGELPFKLSTGYITVESSELFYYFIESEGNPKKDPLLLWYSGGPGCSTFNGLIYEIGPLAFNITDYEGGIPPLKYYPYSWTKSASILFIDAPVGTGFSYATNITSAYPTSDSKSAAQTYTFLKKWFFRYPQFLTNELFIGADSYSGISAPIFVQHIANGNKDGDFPRFNLKGYIVGCPRTDSLINENSIYSYSHRLALISDELYGVFEFIGLSVNPSISEERFKFCCAVTYFVLLQAMDQSCNGNYVDVDPNNAECFENIELADRMIKDINKKNILEPKCTWSSPDSDEEPARRSLGESSGNFISSSGESSEFWCHNFNYSMSYWWANDESVQSALNVRPNTVENWVRCNKTLDYTMDVQTVLDVHRNLSKLGLQALVYNGDHDLTVPNTGTQQWVSELNLTVVNPWRPWFVDGEPAGYTIKYTGKTHGYRLTYATVLGAGHSPQEYKRRECFDMFQRWIHYYPL